jgi:hypothetical protein
MILYELAVMGVPSDAQVGELEQHVSQVVEAFGLRLKRDITWWIRPDTF